MPLVRIDLRAGTPPSVRRVIADGVHQALVETITIPSADRFQLISEYKENWSFGQGIAQYAPE